MKADFLTKQANLQRFVFQHLTDTWSQMVQKAMLSGHRAGSLRTKGIFRFSTLKKKKKTQGISQWGCFMDIKKEAQFGKTTLLHTMCGMLFTHSLL